MSVLLGNKEYFKGIEQIKYEGPESDNPLAFRWYDENKVVAGKTMKDHFKFACATGIRLTVLALIHLVDPHIFFHGMKRKMPVERAKDKMDAAFEFITKLNLPYYCFHDVDVVDYTDDIAENDKQITGTG